MNKNKKKGFTLVELLAVIVILAIILVIAVPKIMETIKKAKTGSMESSAKLIAKSLETNYQVSLANGEAETLSLTGSCLDAKIADIDLNEYESCTYTITDGKVKVTLKGKDSGKFAGLTCTDATKTTATCSNEPEPLVTNPVSFSTDTWETIINAVKNNNISAYSVGDTKCVALDGFTTTNDNGCSYGEFAVRIANTSTPSECSNLGYSETACGFVLEFADIITIHNMNDTNTNVGGWPATSMRTYVNDTIYNALPEELREGIINTTVISGHGSTSGETNFTSTDKLYLLSTVEVWGTIDYDTLTASETRQLDYYKNNNVTLSDNLNFVVKNESGSAYDWWLRAAISLYSSGFFSAYHDGSYECYIAAEAYGVSPAFRLG